MVRILHFLRIKYDIDFTLLLKQEHDYIIEREKEMSERRTKQQFGTMAAASRGFRGNALINFAQTSGQRRPKYALRRKSNVMN